MFCHVVTKLQFVLFLLIPFWLAQSQVASSNDSNQYSISGVVQNSVTGEAIAHALVEIGGRSSQPVFSDSQGRFQFDHLAQGITAIEVRKPGFLDLRRADPMAEGEVATDQGMVTIGPENPSLVIRLVPEGVIFGRAQKSDGEPIGRLTIQLFSLQINQGRRRWQQMNNTMTREDGEFRIAGLPPNRYYLVAGPRPQTTWIAAPGHRAVEGAYRPVFFPGVTDLASASGVDVGPGQQVEADFSLNPDPVFQVSGAVAGIPADENGENVFPRVQVISRENNTEVMPVAEESGNEFHALVPAGSFTLRADVDSPPGSYRGEVPIDVQSNETGVNLLVSPVPPIRIEVTVQRTRAENSTENRSPDVASVHFLGHGTQLPSPESMFTASTGGSNAAAGMDAGPYTVEIQSASSEELYVDSAQCGGTDLLREDLVIGHAPLPPIRIVLRDDGGRISGNVLSEGHGARGTVLFLADRAPQEVQETFSSSSSGQFQSRKLAPGDYTVLAFDHTAGLEYTNPEVMSAYSSNATHVTVIPNGESRVSVNLVRTKK